MWTCNFAFWKKKEVLGRGTLLGSGSPVLAHGHLSFILFVFSFETLLFITQARLKIFTQWNLALNSWPSCFHPKGWFYKSEPPLPTHSYFSLSTGLFFIITLVGTNSESCWWGFFFFFCHEVLFHHLVQGHQNVARPHRSSNWGNMKWNIIRVFLATTFDCIESSKFMVKIFIKNFPLVVSFGMQSGAWCMLD